MALPEADIEKIISALNAIPEPLYKKASKFMKKIVSNVQSYPDTNYVRLHVENAEAMMEFYERVKSDPSNKQIAIAKEKMKKLGPKFAENLVKIGHTSASAPHGPNTNKLRVQHIDLVIGSIKELDSKTYEKLKSYSNETMKELKEAGIKQDNVVMRHISKIKVLFDVYEATGGKKPNKEFLEANPWVLIAFDSILPIFSQEMVYLAEFANVV